MAKYLAYHQKPGVRFPLPLPIEVALARSVGISGATKHTRLKKREILEMPG